MNSENSEHVLDLEQIPDGEDEAIKVIDLELQILQKRIDQEHLGTSERPVTRAQHPKQHGCVKAEFVIADDIPREFRSGIFNESGQIFPAWIRFSNARKQDDREPGGHGMAIKLMGVIEKNCLPATNKKKLRISYSWTVRSSL